MKRFDVGVAVGIAAMIWGAVAHAEQTTYTIGMGNLSCGKYIASIGKRPPGKMQSMTTRDGEFVSENVAYIEWLLGFVSGFNATLSAFNAAHPGEEQQQIESIDAAGADLWMRNWCNQHPVKTVFEGAETFITEMRTNAAAAQR
jgi:hypothetical protein